MSVVRRSLTVVAVAATALAVLSPGASADSSAPSIGKPHVALASRPAVARGLIIQTTTSTPSKSVLKSAKSAIGSEADAINSEPLTGKISTIAFDQNVPESVAQDAAEQVEKRSDVVWAVPDTLRHAAAAPPVVPNDPYFASQRDVWDSATTTPKGGYSIKAPALWQKTKGSSDVVVAVVDTGILKEDADIKNQLVDGYDMIGSDQDEDSNPIPGSFETDGDGVPGRDSDPSDPGDWTTKNECGSKEPAESSSWHGTFIAGMIAAQANNSVGIAGIAPNVKIQPVRVLGHCGGYDSDVLAGITWASGGHVDGVPDNPTPAKVVNLSLGSLADSTAERDDACTAYATAAALGRARGAVFIAAAGNEGGNANLDVPAACSGFTSVGATSLRGFSSWYSNIGSSVDISAPGGDTLVEGSKDSVLSLVNSSATSPNPETAKPTLARYEGTSMSTAEVSAAAALLFSLGLDTPDKVKSALYSSASKFRSRSSSYGKKKIKLGGHTYYFDLNCSGHSWCGDGILDLSKVQVPLGVPTLSGTPIIGEPFTAVPPPFVAPGPIVYQWFGHGGHQGVGVPPGSSFIPDPGPSPVYYPSQSDAGQTISVSVRPGTELTSIGAFGWFSATSAPSAVVLAGPNMEVNSYAFYYAKHGVDQVVTVRSPDVQSGPVELRSGDHTVLGSGTLEGGTADITVPGDKVAAGSYPVRAAFLGDATTNPASSPGVWVKVSKAASLVTTSLASSVKTSSHASLRVTIKVTGDPNPTGEFKVYDNGHRIITTSLSSSAGGKKTVSLPHLKKGGHSIQVVYLGSSNIVGGKSHYEHIKAK